LEKTKVKKEELLIHLKKENKVVVEGVNIVKKHLKANGSNQTGGIVDREAKIDASNVMVIDKKTNKPTRIYSDVDKKTNKKVRVSKSHEKLD
jgi:large subunit ribosomal protein L24